MRLVIALCLLWVLPAFAQLEILDPKLKAAATAAPVSPPATADASMSCEELEAAFLEVAQTPAFRNYAAQLSGAAIAPAAEPKRAGLFKKLGAAGALSSGSGVGDAAAIGAATNVATAVAGHIPEQAVDLAAIRAQSEAGQAQSVALASSPEFARSVQLAEQARAKSCDWASGR